MPIAHLPSSALTPAHVPASGSSWDDVAAFAHTFHAYKVVGSLPGAARITDEVRTAHDSGQPLPSDLTRLRTALFVTVRASSHGHTDPGDEAFCRALVVAVGDELRSP